ncbi:MAG: hypothetical protein K8S54_07585 [Spirochaetia bacterium]|nr:hypothetical protein [Spirochaetia bacterium]
MRLLILTIATLASLTGACISQKPEAMQANRLSLTYNSSTLRINIEGSALLVTRIEQEFANPVSAIPSGTKATTMQGLLTPEQLGRLTRTIQNNGFMKLSAAYGAPEGQRFYPYRIEACINGETKQVLYRSNPAYESAPNAFSEVEKLLIDLTAAARNPVSR